MPAPHSLLKAFLSLWSYGILSAQIIPVSTSPPGELPPEQVPQIIHITLDDAVTPSAFDNVQLISPHLNPDNQNVTFTFYISLDYSDYWLIHRLYAAGHEIAVHTITHSTSTSTDHTTWIRELEGTREALHRYAGIPRENIRGFRAPYLAYNGDTFQALADLGFAYDCSISEGAPGLHSPDPASLIWPYTLHDGIQQHTDTGTGPDAPLPSLMVVPMWKLFEGDKEHLMDPLLNTGRLKEEIVQLFKDNFTTRYHGNRAPMGIWLHPAWIADPKNVEALNEFLEWALAHENVWVVPVAKLADWMQNPIPASELVEQDTFTPHVFEPVDEHETFHNSFAKGQFRSVGQAAHAYPHPDTLYRVNRRSTPFEVIPRWEFEQKDNEDVYLANLFLRTPEDFQVDEWEMSVNLGDNTFQYGWSDNGIDGSSPAPDLFLLKSPGAWNPSLNETEKLVYTLALDGDPDTLSVENPSQWEYQPTPPTLTLRQGESQQSLLSWETTAPLYELKGATHLNQADWKTVRSLYGVRETNLPHDTPYRFFRLIAHP